MTTTPFSRVAARGVGAAIATAARLGDLRTDFRSAICRFEDDLFARYPAGHGLMSYDDASAMLRDIFRTLGRVPPKLALVPGFDDPRVGGYADVKNHRIAIERGYLYRFLVLHESAHLIVPEDRRHGPAFTYVLQLLYRSFVDIPEGAIRGFLRQHGLPDYTGTPVGQAA